MSGEFCCIGGCGAAALIHVKRGGPGEEHRHYCAEDWAREQAAHPGVWEIVPTGQGRIQ